MKLKNLRKRIRRSMPRWRRLDFQETMIVGFDFEALTGWKAFMGFYAIFGLSNDRIGR